MTECSRPRHQPMARNCSGSSFRRSTMWTLLEDFLGLFETDAMLSLYSAALVLIECKPHLRTRPLYHCPVGSGEWKVFRDALDDCTDGVRDFRRRRTAQCKIARLDAHHAQPARQAV